MPADPQGTYAFPLFSDLVRRIEALGFTPGSENPLGWVVAEAERLHTENQRLQAALSHAIDAGFVAVNERDEARADYATLQARYTAAWEALCDIGEQIHAAGHPQLLPERALRVGEGVAKMIGERDAAFLQGVRRGLEEALDVVNTATNAADNRLRATGGKKGADVCDELRAVGDVIAAVDPASVKP
jgi:hypothetical protein